MAFAFDDVPQKADVAITSTLAVSFRAANGVETPSISARRADPVDGAAIDQKARD